MSKHLYLSGTFDCRHWVVLDYVNLASYFSENGRLEDLHDCLYGAIIRNDDVQSQTERMAEMLKAQRDYFPNSKMQYFANSGRAYGYLAISDPAEAALLLLLLNGELEVT